MPALCPDMDYGNLAIQEGTEASIAYLKMIDSKTPTEEKERLEDDLLTYCGHDTLAMVRIREQLLRL